MDVGLGSQRFCISFSNSSVALLTIGPNAGSPSSDLTSESNPSRSRTSIVPKTDWARACELPKCCCRFDAGTFPIIFSRSLGLHRGIRRFFSTHSGLNTTAPPLWISNKFSLPAKQSSRYLLKILWSPVTYLSAPQNLRHSSSSRCKIPVATCSRPCRATHIFCLNSG
jgi:hypothetical protein